MPGTFSTSRSLQYSPSRCFQCSNQWPGTVYVARCLTRPSIAPKSTSRAAWWLSAVTMATPACSSSATVSVSVTSRRTDQDSPLLISLSSQEREVSGYGDVWKGDQEGEDPRGQEQGATAEGENKGNSRPWRRPSRGQKIYRQAFNHRYEWQRNDIGFRKWMISQIWIFETRNVIVIILWWVTERANLAWNSRYFSVCNF